MSALRLMFIISCLFPGLAALAEETNPSEKELLQKRHFLTKVQPLLKAKCLGCHGDGKEIASGFDMRTREGLLGGGELGVGAVPGKPEESPIYQAVLRTGDIVMPPKDRNKLTPDEIAALKNWIEDGLPWAKPGELPSDAWDSGDGMVVKTSGGLSESWTNRRYDPDEIWAFLPRQAVEVPEVMHGGQKVEHPIDAFIYRKMQEQDVEPAPPADLRAWLRRATFDVTGLPPTPEDIADAESFAETIGKVGELVEQSAQASAKSAKETMIDRLLKSDHYGERMAQHWLDVVRYADTAGFANDWERPHAWRYRDYVIRSFNDDKPYDRFILEQIAGDELEPGNPEMKIAVGYLRMGPWEQTGMSVAAVTRQQFLDDVTDSVGLTFLGQGMSCCKCHDHKFDPLPTRDYYRLQAVFASASFDEADVAFLPSEQRIDQQRRKAEVQMLVDADDWMETKQNADSKRRVTKKRTDYLQRAAKRYTPKALSIRSNSGEKTSILLGGALERPGEMVAPGVLSAVAFEHDIAVPTDKFKRRLALAKWIAHERNPLTARVMVNRVWQMHFGRGLVATPNTFGKMGAKPTHPELLDWLAQWFIDNGWSVKKLHKLIMTSDAYQRAAMHPDPESLAEADPKNELLAFFPPRRLSAEELRDAMLKVTGELSPDRGGPGVFPEINWEVALQPRHIMGSVAPTYQPSPKKKDRHRRTIYAFRIRTLANPMLEVFNRPGPDASCARRDETTVTPQVFSLWNGESVHNRALALAVRVKQEADSPEAQIDQAFRLLFGRTPADDERAACLAHVAEMTKHHEANPPKPRPLPTVVEREMIDEQSGVPFRWKEKLHWMLDYERDIQQWEVDAETRALAEVCLVLLNSNEFVYVY